MLEKQIEKYLVDRVKKANGIAYKFVSPARRSVPDRMCVLSSGKIIFVEVKNEKGKLSDGQKREIKRLKKLKQDVYVVYSKDDIGMIGSYYGF